MNNISLKEISNAVNGELYGKIIKVPIVLVLIQEILRIIIFLYHSKAIDLMVIIILKMWMKKRYVYCAVMKRK